MRTEKMWLLEQQWSGSSVHLFPKGKEGKKKPRVFLSNGKDLASLRPWVFWGPWSLRGALKAYKWHYEMMLYALSSKKYLYKRVALKKHSGWKLYKKVSPSKAKKTRLLRVIFKPHAFGFSAVLFFWASTALFSKKLSGLITDLSLNMTGRESSWLGILKENNCKFSLAINGSTEQIFSMIFILKIALK